jgi:phage shock protein A
MGLFNKIARVVKANLDDLASKVEDREQEKWEV